MSFNPTTGGASAAASHPGADVSEPGTSILNGHRGKGDGALSLPERLLAVHGKSDTPLARPLPAAGVAETVLGEDNRTLILETQQPPWRQICALEIEGPNGTFIGTGWFAGPRTLLTAGHCVRDEVQMGGWATSIRVSPGRQGATRPFGTIVATRFDALSQWIDSADRDYDIGCIHLSDNLGAQLGWFAIGAFPDETLTQSLVNISGYPADRGHGEDQYFHANRILRAEPKRLFYDVDTFGGQSGSPAWIYENGSNVPIVVGVHAYGVGGTPPEFDIEANSAPRIRSELLPKIRQWLNEDGS